MAATLTDRGIPLSPLSISAYLRYNSTIHRGPFSAIAELIDNGYDPDVNAKEILIDKTQIKDKECLTFMDNGNGFSPDLMQRKLSDQKAVYGEHPICMYGNGFKSGLMRLGQDAIILSKSKNDLCVGMLSQTYLEIGAKHICVPIISFNKQKANKFSEIWENQASLRDILEHSPFNKEEELLTELHAIEGPTGTKIIIWNLCRTSEGNMELDFTTENDIRIICTNDSGTSVPEIHSSLRAYCSILYLRPSMQINIRGQKVEDRPIYKSLDDIDKSYSYKPKTLEEKIPIIFGYNTKSKEHYGLMMYHKNRLIKAYKRVTTLMTSIGVIGVIECNHLTPTPNKQDFDNDDAYKKTIQSMAEKLRKYSEKRSKNVCDNSNNNSDNNNVPIEEPNNERNDEDGESEETSGEGPSGTKRPRRNCDEGESEMSMRNSAAPTQQLLDAVEYLMQENQDLTAQIENLNSKVAQLEGENASLSEECKQKTKRLEDLENGMGSLLKE